MLTTAYDSSIRQVGMQRWLHELSGRRQRRQYFSTLEIINGLRAVGVGSSSELAEAPQPRFSCTAVQALLAAAHMPNFEPTACGLYAWDLHILKLWCCLLGALGKDPSS